MRGLKLTSLLCAGLAQTAGAGSLGPVADPGFGNAGLAHADHGVGASKSDSGNAAVRQGDRLLIATGASTISADPNTSWQVPALLRLRSDGTPDPAFGNNGWLPTPMPGTSGDLTDVALTADGRIVAVGRYSSDSGQTARVLVTRLSADGVPDTSFGPNGLRLFSFNTQNLPAALALLPDGKLLVMLNHYSGAPPICIGLVRLNTDGSTDSTFRNGGTDCLTSDNPSAPQALGTRLAVQGDGKIVIAGTANHLSPNNLDLLAIRLSADGTPDPTFGDGGFVYTAYDQGGSLSDAANALAIDGAGRIVLAGAFENLDSTDMAVVRLLPNGRLDFGFGTQGRVSLNFGANDGYASANGVAILSGDRILLGGSATMTDATGNIQSRPGVAVLLKADGSPDERFGNSGRFAMRAPDIAQDERFGLGFSDLVLEGEQVFLTGTVDSWDTSVPGNGNYDVAAAKLVLPMFRDGFDGAD